MKLEVTFIEEVERTFTFEVDDNPALDLEKHDEVRYALDAEGAWDQPTKEDWLSGDIVERQVTEVKKVDS